MLWELEALQPPALLGFIRDLLPPPVYRGNEFLPAQTSTDVEYEYIKGASDQPVMAQIITWDAESPIGARQAAGAKVQGELPPIKRKMRISEKEILRFMQPRRGTSDQQDVLAQVYKDMAALVASVQARFEWLQMQALSEDKVIYDEGGIKVQFDFGLTDDQQIDLVTQTDGDGTDVSAKYGPVWTDHVNSTPITDLQTICDETEQRVGRRPSRAVTSRLMLTHMMQSEQIKKWIFPTNAPDRALLPTEVQVLFAQYGIPFPTTYDVQLKAENHDGTTTMVRPMRENTMFLLPATNPGSLLMGPTAESRALIGTAYAQQAPGIWGGVYGMDEPPSEWSKVAAVAFPTMPQADQICQLKLAA